MKKPPGHETWDAGQRQAWKRLEVNYKRRRPRPDRGIDQLSWDQFRSDAGVKVAKGEQVRGYAAPGPATRPAMAMGLYDGPTGVAGGFWWSLDYPAEMRRERGYWRCCVICTDEIEPGQCSVHPVLPDEHGRPDPGAPDWSTAYHVRCVPPHWWGAWLGHPRAALPRSTPWRPRVTEESVAAAIDDGMLTLAPGVAISDAVARIRELRQEQHFGRRMF